MLALPTDLGGRFPNLTSNLIAVQVLQYRHNGRRVKGEEPAFLFLVFRGLSGGGLGGIGQARQEALVLNDFFPCVG